MKQLPYCSIFCGMTGREITDMTCTHEMERSLRLNSGILMNPSSKAVFESCRRYSTKRLGNCAGAELFDPESEGRESKRSKKAVTRPRPSPRRSRSTSLIGRPGHRIKYLKVDADTGEEVVLDSVTPLV